ncbi:MAG: hypothetical protein SH817_08695 [Leptospira sp.]|nr:hypothetical protein [Leptospira sp.]
MKTLYLFGAGASADAVPVVGGITFFWDKYFKKETAKFHKSVYKKIDSPLLEDIDKLIDETKDFGTPDVYAKSVALSKGIFSKEYRIVKTALNYFIILCYLVNEIDKRYFSFFSALVDSENKNSHILHKDVFIATWNYDFQITKSISILLNKNLTDINHLLYNKLFRINGYAGSLRGTVDNRESFRLTQPENENDNYIFRSSFPASIVKDINDSYARIMEDKNLIYHNISFAWEPLNFNLERQQIFPFLDQIKVLVVIGYSFPTFNRFIDKELISKMINLEKIYIQDPSDSIENRIIPFLDIRMPVYKISRDSEQKSYYDIEHIKHPDQFFIPPELDQ